MWYIWLLLFVCYLRFTWHGLLESAAPSRSCEEDSSLKRCYSPLISSAGESLAMELWLFQPSAKNTEKKDNIWLPITTCRLNITIPESNKLPKRLTSTNETSQLCQVTLPDSARQRSSDPHSVEPLKARFVFRYQGSSIFKSAVISSVPFQLTRVKEKRISSSDSEFKTVMDSQKSFGDSSSNNVSSEAMKGTYQNGKEASIWVPYLKYGTAPIRVRFVAEYREYGAGLRRNDGLQLPKWNHTTYGPIIYVDDMSLQHSAEVQLAPPNSNKGPIQLDIQFGAISPLVDVLIRQVQIGIKMIEGLLAEGEIDEIRYFLQDERLYRFFLTQIISFLHMWFDYLAFRDEIKFYKGRRKLTGISTSSVISRLICEVILFLYLLDGGTTSWAVLISLCSSCAIEAWKVWKILRPKIQTTFPFVSVRQIETGKEQETANYDRIAFRYLAIFLYPLVIAWSLYDLKKYEYRSWYSWLISNLANAVYTFGFISLCPQLYVNYRLKSVAHLPWKVFLYKIFNTFVDDAFAWLIEMPWKHRIMTLRDDVVFLMFLLQVYLYRVDKTRTNEFGYSYVKGEDKLKEKED